MKSTVTYIMIGLLSLEGLLGSPSMAHGQSTRGGQASSSGSQSSVPSAVDSIVGAHLRTLSPCLSSDVEMTEQEVTALLDESLKKLAVSGEERELAASNFTEVMAALKSSQCLIDEEGAEMPDKEFNKYFRPLLEEFSVSHLTYFGSHLLGRLQKIGDLRVRPKCALLKKGDIAAISVLNEAEVKSAWCCWPVFCNGKKQRQTTNNVH